MDTLGVRRRCAPKLSGYTVGSLARARAMLRCPVARAGGLARLSEDVYARSTRRSGALKANKYRSGAGYLGILAKIHKQAGHSWSPDLEVARTDAVRSLERGLGPAKRARVVDLEAVVGRRGDTGGTQQGDIDFVIVGALWMLRGAEAAALLGDQVSVWEDSSQASIVLGAFKTNPAGRECTRTLRCPCGRISTCGEDEGADLGKSTCPVHALARVVLRRAGLGLTDKHPLFCGRGMMALTPGSARLAICRACRCDGMSEHSMRRMGAQYYARRGVPLAVIQHIGRWGSATVLKYVDQALEGRASWAPVVAAVGLGGEGLAVGGGVAVRHTALEAGSAGRTTRLGGRLPPGERRRTLAPPRPPVPTDPGALGSAILWDRALRGPRALGAAGGGRGWLPWPPGRRPGGARGPRAPGAVGADWDWKSSIPSRRPGGALGPGGGGSRWAAPVARAPRGPARRWLVGSRSNLAPRAWVTGSSLGAMSCTLSLG